LQDAGCNIDAALAILAETGLQAGPRQQDADLQGTALCAQNRGHGKSRDASDRARQEAPAIG
jgi:hypothetical protein